MCGGIPNRSGYQELPPWKMNHDKPKSREGFGLQMVFSSCKWDETVSASKMWFFVFGWVGEWWYLAYLTIEAFFGRQASHLPHLRRWQSLAASWTIGSTYEPTKPLPFPVIFVVEKRRLFFWCLFFRGQRFVEDICFLK